MKKFVWKLSFLLVAAVSLWSCSSDDDNVTDPGVTTPSHYAYIINNGDYKTNSGSIMSLDSLNKDWVTSQIYSAANGKEMGDAQDAVITGNKLFVTCTSANKIEILNLDGTIIKTVQFKGNCSPRSIVTDGTNVYYSAYSGKVYKMSTTNYAITDSVQVGDHPEGLAIADDKIYVANSDYELIGSNTVSVIDKASFKKTKDIVVVLDPYDQMIAVGDKVFFISNMDYSGNQLQVIDANTDKATHIASATVMAYDQMSNSLVCIYALYSAPSVSYFRYDISTGKTTTFTGTDLNKMPNPGQVSIDPSTGDIYMVDTEKYLAPCSIYVFDKNGKQLRVLQNVGYGTTHVLFNPDGKVN
ncbi:YncE family protein [Prevotella cerevisiae]|jgi:YVTN family beta-propeller protein|uniref:YncE family protein n=1 Tax=Segatella cerevisiae TaxID=2053716 RepID=A0ABT1BYR1_9BACT|nr:YncE family protein [Segatella cerevisiae]MCO6025368.1 YncE family protein [Segatella cerevisiae]